MNTERYADIGIVGLGVMGRNLALNFVDQGFSVAVYDSFPGVLEKVRAELGEKVQVCSDPKNLVAVLKKPAKILFMIKAGKPIDDAIDVFSPLLAAGDILIDGGNSFYRDSERRQQEIKGKGLQFVGLGVSGGEEGARHGPALMGGGEPEALESIDPLFSAIAARAQDGEPCYMSHGASGAGHFVKMVHNGIEYGLMQMLAEVYLLLSQGAGLGHDEIAATFQSFEEGEAASYLSEISAKVLAEIDPETNIPLIDVIVDRAAHKGTGRWTAEAALEYGIATPTIASAVFARALSARNRLDLPKQKIANDPEQSKTLIDVVCKAFPAAALSVYIQGLELIAEAARENNWNTDLAQVARGWRAGCIIRSVMLDPLAAACAEGDVLASAYAQSILENSEIALRECVVAGLFAAIPTPAHSASLAWLDGRRSACLGANLIQGQRDYFGAHTFERKDREGHFHHNWSSNS